MTDLLNKLKTLLPKGKFISSVTVLAGGTALGQGLVVLTLPLLTRLYTPDDLGKLGLFSAFVNTASVTTSLLYEAAIVAAQDDNDAASLTLLAILIATITTPLATLGFYALIKFNLLGFGSLPLQTVLFTLLTLLLISVFQTLRYWLIRKNHFPLLGQVTVMQSVVRSFSQAGLGLLQIGWVGLLLGDLMGRGFGLGRMLTQSWHDLVRWVWPVNVSKLSQVAVQNLKFPLYSLPSSLIDVLAISLSVPILTQLYGPTAGGYFVLAQRTLALPFGLVASSVADAFHSQVASYMREEPHKVKAFFLRTAGTLALIGSLPCIVIGFLGPHLFGLVFGTTWGEAGLLAAVLAPWSWAGLIVSPLSRLVFVLGGQEWKLLYDVASLAALIFGLYTGSKLGFSLAGSVSLLSGLNVLTYVVYFWVLLQIIRSSARRAV
jgi:O-antigen/teichoic acid export membrane protein